MEERDKKGMLIMIEQISECQKCGLCFNQKPLLDCERKCQVFWVGLSAKRKTYDAEIPLSATTNTGKIIKVCLFTRAIR